MLKFDNVTVRLGRKDIVKNISFTVPKGQITALLGKNGSGKSTLIRAANGLVPFTGEILFDGQRLSPSARARKAAFLPQRLPDTELSVREVVALGRHPHTGLTGKLGREDEAIVEGALERLNLAGLARRRVNSLSGGERQRVFLAQLLSQQTPLLVLDEPATYMDPGAAARLEGLCKALRVEGHTLLTVMHDPGRALMLADHIVVLEEGRISFAGSAAACLEGQVLQRLFGLRLLTAEGHLFFVEE